MTPPSGTFSVVSAGGLGQDYACGVRTDGAVECWGSDWHGKASPPPGTFASVGTGWDHTCGIRTNGAVACWGDSDDGKTQPPPGRFTSLGVGDNFTCGVRSGRDRRLLGIRRPTSGHAPPSGTFDVSQRRVRPHLRPAHRWQPSPAGE